MNRRLPRRCRGGFYRERTTYAFIGETTGEALVLESRGRDLTITLPPISVPPQGRVRWYQAMAGEERFQRTAQVSVDEDWQVIGWQTLRGIRRHGLNAGRWLPWGERRGLWLFLYSVVTAEGESLPRECAVVGSEE